MSDGRRGTFIRASEAIERAICVVGQLDNDGYFSTIMGMLHLIQIELNRAYSKEDPS
jgi:hypothetical protein